MPTLFDVAWLVPVLPLLAFVVISLGAGRNRSSSEELARYGVALSCALALAVFASAAVAAGELPVEVTLVERWFSLGGDVALGLYVDGAGALVLFSAALVCLTAFFGVGRAGSRPARFFGIVSLLLAGVFGTLILDNLLAVLLCWVLVDVCVSLLIALGRAGKPLRGAALRAFVITRVSDLCLLLGLASLYAGVGSLAYRDVLAAGLPADVAWLLLVGIAGKSAQFPFHAWLPGAHDAPAPVSTLVHTIVPSSGVFLLVRLLPLLETSDGGPFAAGSVGGVAVAGVVSVAFFAFAAVAQRDVRRALSFSVAGQLAMAITALGMGAVAAGVLYLVTTVLSAALLLLAAASSLQGLRHGMASGGGLDPDDVFDAFRLGGLRARQPVAFWAFVAGAVALAGFPFVTGGFWARDAILARAWADSRAVFWILVVAAGVMGFGLMRLVCLTFARQPRSRSAAQASRGTVSVAALVILAVLAVGSSWAGIEQFPLVGGDGFAWFLGAEVGEQPFAWTPTLLGIASCATGFLVGYVVYTWPLEGGEVDPVEAAMRRFRLGWLYAWARGGFGVERACRGLLVRGSLRLAEALASFDGVLERAVDRLGRTGGTLAQAGAWVDGRVLDAAVGGVGRAGQWVSGVACLFDAVLGRLGDWIGAGGLVLARLSDVVDRWALDRAVDAAGSAVSRAGLWFRPRTGKVQSYLLLALVAILVLVATFMFLFT